MSGDPWSDVPAALARIERLNDAYARGEIEIDEFERKTADMITRASAAAPAPSSRSP